MTLTERKRNILHELYTSYQNPASFGGIRPLYEAAKKHKITLADVKAYLSSQPSYTLHRVTRKRFPRQRTVASLPRKIITCDLADMRKLSPHNDKMGYLLICADVFSRYAQVRALRTKSQLETATALQSILDEPASKGVSRLFTDEGAEFLNKQVQDLLQSRGIRWYTTYSKEIKSAIAERLIRTIKARIYRYLSHNQSQRYIDALPGMVDAYNHRGHRGLNGATPHRVHWDYTRPQLRALYLHMYGRPNKYKNESANRLRQIIGVGDTVRIARASSAFGKGYDIQNTLEIFRVKRVETRHRVPIFYLEDLAGEAIDGIFYRQELTPTSLPDAYPFRIIRSRRTAAGKKEYLVSWVGYPPKFNSYISESDVVPAMSS